MRTNNWSWTNSQHIVVLMLFLLLVTGSSGAATAQQPTKHTPYTLRQSVVAPGGRSSEGIYTVTTVVGQPASSEQTNGVYTLASGFLSGSVGSGSTPTAVATRPLATDGRVAWLSWALITLLFAATVLLRRRRA